VVLHSHAVVTGHTEIGPGTQIYPFASIGHVPQDLKFGGEDSRLIIGANNVIREQVTMNPGTKSGGMVTRVGEGGLYMVGAHVAHDCLIGDRVIMANNATLGGHVEVGDRAIIGGMSAVHQFVRIGTGAIIGGMSGVEHDVLPYAMVAGERANLSGLNVVGLKRQGFAREEIRALQRAFDLVFEDRGTLADRVARLAAEPVAGRGVDEVVAFLRDRAQRSLCRPRAGKG
jgi:UDP-N-acetylglucosamine acyltransferase